MFEIKMEDILRSKESDEEKSFLYQARNLQICDTIQSLSEGEFVELQRSFHQVFMEVLKLQDIVKDGIMNREVVGSIRNKLKDCYLTSTEKSSYYREQYLNIEKFLANLEEKKTNTNADRSENAVLRYKFFEAIEGPNLNFQNLIQSAIYSREDIQKRIYEKNGRLEEAKELTLLCQNMKQELSGLFAKETARIPSADIYERLVKPLRTYPEVSLKAETIGALKGVKATKVKKSSHSSQELVDQEIQELKDSIESEFTMEKISEVIGYVQFLLPKDTEDDKARMEEVIGRLEQIKNYPAFMLKFTKGAVKKEILEILQEAQELSRAKQTEVVEDNGYEKAQSFAVAALQMEFGTEGTSKGQNVEVLAGLIHKQRIDDAIQTLRNMKARQQLTEFFVEFYAPYTSIAEQRHIRQVIQEGKMDEVMNHLLMNVENSIPNFHPGKYSADYIELYEESTMARGICEDEIIDAVLAGRAYQKMR